MSACDSLGEWQFDAIDHYLQGDSWADARAGILDTDKRVLVIGPGPNSGDDKLTDYAVAVLRRAGLDARSLPRDHDVEQEIAASLRHPVVVILAKSVGAACEALLLLEEMMKPRLNLPTLVTFVDPTHDGGHFARVARERYRHELLYDKVNLAVGAELGVEILKRVNPIYRRRGPVADARETSGKEPSKSDDISRRLLAEGHNVEAPYPTAKLFTLAVAVILCLVVLPPILFRVAGLPDVAVLAALFVPLAGLLLFSIIVMRRENSISERGFTKLVVAWVDLIRDLRKGGSGT